MENLQQLLSESVFSKLTVWDEEDIIDETDSKNIWYFHTSTLWVKYKTMTLRVQCHDEGFTHEEKMKYLIELAAENIIYGALKIDEK